MISLFEKLTGYLFHSLPESKKKQAWHAFRKSRQMRGLPADLNLKI